MHGAADRPGETVHESGSGHGMWTKCEERRLGLGPADECRGDVEVVVVEEDRCVGLALELGHHGARERAD